MKNLNEVLMFLIVLFTAGCSSTYENNDPVEWNLGDEVEPIYGCKELRKENPQADC